MENSETQREKPCRYKTTHSLHLLRIKTVGTCRATTNYGPMHVNLSWVDLACTRDVFAVPTLRKLRTASLASLLLDILFYKGLAGSHYLLEKNI